MASAGAGPTPISEIALEYVQNFVQGEINEANSNANSGYQLAYQNWTIQQIGPPPAPPVLKVLNQPLAIQLFISWSNSAYSGPSTTTVPSLDLSSAITTIQAAPIQPLPPAVPPPPVDPVGPPTGGYDQFGHQTFYNVAGETPAQFPNGTTFTDPRGMFVHQVTATPFGLESQWVMMAPIQPAAGA